MFAPILPDWGFYTGHYGGTKLEEADFRRFARHAVACLAHYRNSYQMEPNGPEAEQLALCHIAETLDRFEKAQDTPESLSVGSVSMHSGGAAQLTDAQKSRELYRVMGLYFDIYRGPGERER